MALKFAIDLAELGALDSASRLPLYAQLADMLSKRIHDDHSALAGRALPSEAETATHFNISRPTVRQAMAQLHSKGLIVRGRGRGTFVAPPRASRHLGRAFEFDLLPANHRVEFRILARERVVPDLPIRDLFNLGKNQRIERVTRLRLADGEIFGFEERYLPLQFAAQIDDAALEVETGVIFARRLIGDGTGRVEFRIRATAADKKAAQLLKMKKGAPLLASEHTYYSSDGAPVLQGTVLFRGDRYDFNFLAPVHGVRSQNGRSAE